MCCGVSLARNGYKANKDNIQMNKRAELTSSQIIAIVLAIAGLVIVLLFIGVLKDDTLNSDSELCRLAVLTRATAPTFAQSSVPLKCTTEKICFSEKGSKDECPQFYGESNVRVVKVEGKNAYEKAAVIESTSAEKMYQCWSMMGQGKLDIFGAFGDQLLGSTGQATCVICSRLALGRDIGSDVAGLVDLPRYLETAKLPLQGSDLTYHDAFAGDKGAASFDSVSKNLKLSYIENTAETKINGNANDQIAFVFSQVKTTSASEVLKNWGIVAVGGAFSISQIPGLKTAAGALVLNPAGLAVSALVGGTAAGLSAFNAYQGQRAAAGFCGQFTTAADGKSGNLKSGCSVIQAVNYNVQDINAICPSSIQGNP